MAAGLPNRVTELLRSSMFTQFATVNSAGVPIDTPMLCLPSEGLRTIDIATGLAYPAKAERARKNPKVGLLIEGGPGEPVVSVAGIAAVRDANLQANAERYIAETSWANPSDVPWSEARKANFYWSRIFVSVTPKRVLWWDTADAMDEAPNRWDVPPGTVFPKSDPEPPGAISAPSKWEQRPWPEQARDAVSANLPGHISLCDDEGFPLPIRAREIELHDDGFRVDLPKGAPWRRSGLATLTFEGRATFVGAVKAEEQAVVLRVERALPVLPLLVDQSQVWNPSPSIYNSLMARLRHEVARRGQPIPTPPKAQPESTIGAKRRIARISQLQGERR